MLAVLLLGVTLTTPAIDEQLVRELNAMPDMTWTAGISKRFADLTAEELRSMTMDYSYFRRDDTPYTMIETDEPIPKEWKFEEIVPHCMTEVQDEGRCRSDWAFSEVTSFGDSRCLAGLDPDPVDYSVQFEVSCATGPLNCEGTCLFKGWGLIHRTGLPTTECVPYSKETFEHADPGRCLYECVDGSAINLVRASGEMSEVGRENISNIQRAIMTYGPVITSLTIYEDFHAYKSGIYQHKKPKAVDDILVTITGWGVEDGVDYWVCRNSWGSDWGEKGFFRIIRGVNECRVETYVLSGKV